MPSPLETPPAGVYQVRIARGSIYLDRELYQLFLLDVSCVAAVLRDGRAYLLPLRGPSAGGLLLKVRNARGDRVLHAEEFLRSLGIDTHAPERKVSVCWDRALAGLLLEEIAG